jgi:hypothetical protein
MVDYGWLTEFVLRKSVPLADSFLPCFTTWKLLPSTSTSFYKQRSSDKANQKRLFCLSLLAETLIRSRFPSLVIPYPCKPRLKSEAVEQSLVMSVCRRVAESGQPNCQTWPAF